MIWRQRRSPAYRLMVVMSARDRELVGVDSYLKAKKIWAYPQAYREALSC